MNKELLIEALEIAVSNFQYDNETDKEQAVRDYLETLYAESMCEMCESNEKESPEGKWCTSCKDDYKESDSD